MGYEVGDTKDTHDAPGIFGDPPVHEVGQNHMYRENNRHPRTEPCGTPHVILTHSEIKYLVYKE